jgi:hypothetical protein
MKTGVPLAQVENVECDADEARPHHTRLDQNAVLDKADDMAERLVEPADHNHSYDISFGVPVAHIARLARTQLTYVLSHRLPH